jgi:predicted nucleic acid-binding protein
MELLDTDVLIDVQRGHPPAVAWFSSLSAAPAVLVMELIQSARNRLEVDNAMKLVAPLRKMWPSEEDCDRALADFSQFHLSHGLGLLDALIAATAIGQGAKLCIFNLKHYSAVAGLVLSAPYVR